MQLMPGGVAACTASRARLVAERELGLELVCLVEMVLDRALVAAVMKIMSVMPAAAASSTAYWMSGLSTTGSISFGLALVTGRKRLPSPATEKPLW